MPHLPTHAKAIREFSGPSSSPLGDLQARIAAQRTLLAAWQDAREAARARYAQEIAPLHDTYCELLIQQVQQLDVASTFTGLSKVDRAALREWIAELAGVLASASRAQALRADMQNMQRRHAEAAKQPVPPPDDDIETDLTPPSPAPADDIHPESREDWESARAYAEKRRAAHHATRRRSKRTESMAPATPSLRAVYRRVASALHPDRETDPAAREHKTALMQQANRAYAAEDLLGLLELLGEHHDALAPYQALLGQQLSALEREVAAAPQAFCEEFGVNPGKRFSPEKAVASLRPLANALQDAIVWQRATLRNLPNDAAGVRRWLREEMAIRRQHST